MCAPHRAPADTDMRSLHLELPTGKAFDAFFVHGLSRLRRLQVRRLQLARVHEGGREHHVRQLAQHGVDTSVTWSPLSESRPAVMRAVQTLRLAMAKIRINMWLVLPVHAFVSSCDSVVAARIFHKQACV